MRENSRTDRRGESRVGEPSECHGRDRRLPEHQVSMKMMMIWYMVIDLVVRVLLLHMVYGEEGWEGGTVGPVDGENLEKTQQQGRTHGLDEAEDEDGLDGGKRY